VGYGSSLCERVHHTAPSGHARRRARAPLARIPCGGETSPALCAGAAVVAGLALIV